METVEIISKAEIELDLECDDCGNKLDFIVKETNNRLRVFVDKCKHCTKEIE